MRKATLNNIGFQSNTGSRGKKTSIGRKNIGTSTMNKHTKRMRKKKYRGQGR
jgi:hypothetical protein